MDQPKLVDNEAVGQSLRMEVVSNEPLMGPDPSVSRGTAKSVKLSSIMQINLQEKKEDSSLWSPPYLPGQTEASAVSDDGFRSTHLCHEDPTQ
jgi:hypothetical protein